MDRADKEELERWKAKQRVWLIGWLVRKCVKVAIDLTCWIRARSNYLVMCTLDAVQSFDLDVRLDS